ncbi:MAG: carbohydrate porin, partial [Anderseniella sp.]
MNETMGGQASLQKLLRPIVANARVGAVAKMIPPYLDRYLIAFALSLAIDMPALAQTSGSTGLGGPSSVQGELQPGDGLTDPQFRSTIVQDALPTWFAWKEMLAEEYGLSFKVDYLSLGQWSDADIGEGQAGSGIARLYGSWAPFETGSLTFKVENRHAYGAVTPQFFGFDGGALSITGTAFNDIGTALTNLFWTQRAEDRSWTIQVGQIDVTDFVDIYGLVSPYTSFQNLAFNTNPTINAPNPGLGIAAGAKLSDHVYVIGSIADANGDPASPDFGVFQTGETFKSMEIGFMSSQDRIYFDNIHLTLWHGDAADDGSRPEDYGAAFSAAWLFNNTWMPFLRAGISQGKAALYKKSVSAGLGYYSRQTDLAGIGLNWADPGSAFSNDQFTAEAFYRFTVSTNVAITLSIQH